MYNEKYFQAWEEGIGPGQFKKIKRKVIRMAAIPKEDWPKWAKLIARYRKPGHEGVGDTFEYIADKVGGRQIKAWSKRLRIPCGCGGRKRKFNTQYPYTD